MNRKTKNVPSIPKVRVITDPRDARKDQFIPEEEVRAKYKNGELSWDITNHAYTTN